MHSKIIVPLRIFLFSFLLISFFSFRNDNILSPQYCVEKNTSFLDGEVLTYKAYYNWKVVWIPAGEITFSVKETPTEYQYTAIGKSYPSYDNFFRVNDYYATTVEKETMLPKSFVRHVEEGDYRKFDSLAFDHQNMIVNSFNGKTRQKAIEKSFEIDSCALDLLSVMYALRNTKVEEYEPGDYLDISMFFDEETFPIKVNYKKRQKKKIKDLGKFKTLKVTPELIVGNVFKEGDVMNIWVSDDKNKVPLLVESPISIGSIKAVLKSYSGLRNPSILK